MYIKLWIGGVRPLRKLLGQAASSTNQWTRETAILAFKLFYERFGITPGQAKSRPPATMTETDRLHAQNICGAVEKYAGGVRALTTELNLTIRKQTKWSAERVLHAYQDLFRRYAMTPHQIVSLSAERKKIFDVRDADIELARNLADATGRYYSGATEVFRLIGATVTDVRTLQKRLKGETTQMVV